MKTSAGIYFNRSVAFRYLLFVLTLLLISACATTGYDGSRRKGYAIASWYGPGFHGKLTASGERYNMYALTCAHKSLPFGTKLKVTNVVNGKSTVVVVNDRGPFVRGRDLDLSYAAAKKIGLIGPGTAKVKVEYLGRIDRYRKYVKRASYNPAKKGPFTIQVGSFKELSNASHLKMGLELERHKVYILKTWINGELYYRVRVGKFKTERAAYRYAEKLADEGYSVFITRYEERI
jgi:rare lipoprotein A